MPVLTRPPPAFRLRSRAHRRDRIGAEFLVHAGSADPICWCDSHTSACVAPSNSPHSTPACTVAVRPGPMLMLFIEPRSMTRPSSHTAVPATPCPPPRTVIVRSRSNRSAAATSSEDRHRATYRGLRSMAPFQTARARHSRGHSACSAVASIHRSAQSPRICSTGQSSRPADVGKYSDPRPPGLGRIDHPSMLQFAEPRGQQRTRRPQHGQVSTGCSSRARLVRRVILTVLMVP